MRRDEAPDPDLKLVTAVAGGNEAAFDNLIARYGEPVFHFIYRHVSNETDARELALEVFVRVYFNIAKFRPDAKFSTWVYQIALNLCRDHFKSRHTRQSAVTESLSRREDGEGYPSRELAAEIRTPSAEAITREKMAALDAGIQALPIDLRAALVLTVLDQRSHQECAELLRTTPKAIETRVYRARKLLREWLANAGIVLVLAGLMR